MSKHFEIIVGTMLGASEYVADAIAEKLDASGHTHTIHAEPNLDNINTASIWVVCTSTHGAGELPDGGAAGSGASPFTGLASSVYAASSPWTLYDMGAALAGDAVTPTTSTAVKLASHVSCHAGSTPRTPSTT